MAAYSVRAIRVGSCLHTSAVRSTQCERSFRLRASKMRKNLNRTLDQVEHERALIHSNRGVFQITESGMRDVEHRKLHEVQRQSLRRLDPSLALRARRAALSLVSSPLPRREKVVPGEVRDRVRGRFCGDRAPSSGSRRVPLATFSHKVLGMVFPRAPRGGAVRTSASAKVEDAN